jgi:hypothetical protein
MNSFMQSALDGYFHDIQVKIEVYDIVRELVDDVEYWGAENQLRRAQKNLALTQQLNDAVIEKLKDLNGKNDRLNAELAKLKDGAVTTRELFVRDIGHFLAENKQVQKLKDKISEMEIRLHNYAVHGTDVLEPEEQEVVLTDATQNGKTEEEASTESESNKVDETAPLSSVVSLPQQVLPPAPKPEQQMFVYDLDDEFLMSVFAFMDTPDILNVASTCKYLSIRVVNMFAMDSAVARPEWAVRPDRQALLAQAASQSTDPISTAGTAVVPATPDRSAINSSKTNSTPERKSALGAVASSITATLAALPLTSSASAKGDTAAPGTAQGTAPAPMPAAPSLTPAPVETGLTKEIIDVLIKKLTGTLWYALLKTCTTDAHPLSSDRCDDFCYALLMLRMSVLYSDTIQRLN